MPFREVKAHAIFHLLELEKLGLITRDDGYQGILNAIAGDVRSKHRKRIQRQEERASMLGVLKTLGERKKAYEEEIKSYNDYVEGAMKTMQKSGKGLVLQAMVFIKFLADLMSRWKRFTMPFTKQYFHLRDLQKSGKLPQFGSFKYSAHYLYDKGILLSIDQFSPRQFDKIDIVISSNSVGIFTLEVFNNALGITNRMATTELRMEDLLQAQFDGKSTLPIFEGMAKVHLSALLVHINKKYVNMRSIFGIWLTINIQVLHTIVTPVLYPSSTAIFPQCTLRKQFSIAFLACSRLTTFHDIHCIIYISEL